MARRTKVGALMVLGVAVLLLFGTILPASALGPAGAMIFRGVASSPGICYPGLATVNPSGSVGCGTDGINRTDTRSWGLDIGSTTDGYDHSADFCVGANSNGQVGLKTFHPNASVSISGCDLKGGGLVKSGPAYEAAGFTSPVRVGPYCGASHGTGSTWTIVGTTTNSEQVEWIQSAGTVLPTFDGDPNNTTADDANGNGVIDPGEGAISVLVAGVTDAVGALGGGNCGATKASVAFNVIGVAVAIGQ